MGGVGGVGCGFSCPTCPAPAWSFPKPSPSGLTWSIGWNPGFLQPAGTWGRLGKGWGPSQHEDVGAARDTAREGPLRTQVAS